MGDTERARAVARVTVRLAAQAGATLPSDLRLWALAGGRPAAGESGRPDDEAKVAAADGLAFALEAATGPDRRRTHGLHVTPAWLADRLVSRALDGLDGLDAAPAVTVCDPACGGGAFLVAAARGLHRRGVDRRRIVRELLWGADIDPVGVAVAEAALALWAGDVPPAGRLVVADVLGGGAGVWPDPPREGFGAVVGNPPFQNQLGRATAWSADRRHLLRARFGAAVRAYTDAAWVFLLLGCELARAGGRVALVQPQSLVGARDAAAVRTAVDERARLRELWVDDRPVFSAAVRVCAPVLEVGGPGEPSADAGNDWSDRLADVVGIPRIDPATTGTIADLADVITGFRDEYYGLVDHVREHDAPGDPPAPLVTSGLVDWLAISWGCRSARFARRTWRAPTLDLGSLARAGSHKARRWVARTRVPKLVVATQTRVLEPAVDVAGSWVPSVPMLAVVPHDPGSLWRLAAAVASPAATAWLHRRAPGTALARGALKVAASDLSALPLPADAAALDEAAAAVRVLVTEPTGSGSAAAVRERFLEAAAAAYGTPAPVTEWWRSRADGAAPAPHARQ